MSREHIVEAARDWIGTPYRHQASKKGVGADCLGLLRGGWRDVIGVGHSLGGVLTLYAAIRRPDLFRALVFIDPVFLPPAVLAQVAARNAGEAIYDMQLVQSARRRRDESQHKV